MLASKYNEKRVQNILKTERFLSIQEKFDGCRVHLLNNKVYTRSGKEILNANLNEAIRDIQSANCNNIILDGELLVREDDDTLMERKKANGIINRMLHGNAEDEYARLDIRLFDMINLNAPKEPYFMRANYLRIFLEEVDRPETLVESHTAYSTQEIQTLFKEYLNKGSEGIMIKSVYNTWSPKRVGDIMKLKAELTADLEVIAYTEGTGKYEGMLGALVCRTRDNKLLVKVGTGLTDADRGYPPPIGSIVEVKYNAIISNVNEPTKSLFLPVYLQVRTDKQQANALDELQ